MANTTTKAHLAVLAANAIYGINFNVAKLIMPSFIQPFGFIFLRVSGALILFGTISLFLKKETIQRADWPRFIACGVFGVAINQLFFFGGLNLTTPINAAIIMITTPILVMVLGALFLKEKLTTAKTIGLLLGVVGALSIITSGGKGFSIGGSTALGDLMILINATSYAVYMILVKPLMRTYSTMFVITRVFLIGFIGVIPFGWKQVMDIQWHTFTAHTWGCLAFVVIGTTFFAYLLNTYGLSKISPSVVSFYIYLQPFLAASFAMYWGTDTLTTLKVFSALLIFIGVYLISKKPSSSLKTI
ncbi:MAG: DMT family transporter [Bacteroidia bacterium]|nr:DMT family transporter [Bacteroidia bacterium]